MLCVIKQVSFGFKYNPFTLALYWWDEVMVTIAHNLLDALEDLL